MGIKQVDLYLIHNPRQIEGPIEDGWKEFEKIKEGGLSKCVSKHPSHFLYLKVELSDYRSIGVSNFNLEQLQQLVKVAKIKPAVNQVCV